MALVQTVKTKRTVKKKHVFNLMILTFLACSAVFGYLFLTQTDVPALTTGIGPGALPAFSRMLYGGFDRDSLNKPMDVLVTDQYIYVTDANNKRVQVFDPGGTPVFRFGQEGTGPGRFKFPYGISADSKGNIYIADLYNGCISVHDAKGKFIRYFAERDPGEKVINSPGGLRIAGNRLYVTEIQGGKVLVFDLAGKKLQEIGKPGRNPGEMLAPNAVVVDREGHIYVTDTGNQRVQVFDQNGRFLRIINGSPGGQGPSAFVNPRGIGLDSQDRFYVVSNMTHFIYVFDKDGRQIAVLGGFGEAVDQFALPNGLFITGNDEIYITDTMNKRVAVWE